MAGVKEPLEAPFLVSALADSPRQIRLLEDRLRETLGAGPGSPPRASGWPRHCVRHVTS